MRTTIELTDDQRAKLLALAATTTVIVHELYSGAARSSDRRLLDEFLPTLTILPLDARSARYAGAVDQSLRQKGRAINPGDNLIAGIRLAHDFALVTRNVSYFRRVPDLKVVTIEEPSR